MYNGADTIAAISTPPGKGGVALIRVSGPQATEFAARCVALRNGQALSSLPPRHLSYADVLYEGEPIDDVLVSRFAAPHSYTGEDTVEITCHGGVLITRTVLAALFAAGARQAEAGEFTRRACLNGRLSLTDAEGIGAVLEAKSVAQLRLSAAASRSRLSRTLSELHDDALSLMGALYARIDYPEEDLSDLSLEETVGRLRALRDRMRDLLSTYRTGRAINEGIPTVLCGAPNVGKSSLYNRLCGEDLAIVTDTAGTTRDVLTATFPLGRVLLHLCDTAGLRDTTDPVERIGVARSRARMEESELILAVFDGSRAPEDEDCTLIADLMQHGGCVIALCNKADLPANPQMTAALAVFPHVLPVSAVSGAGLDALRALVEDLFTDGAIDARDTAVVTSARQEAALRRALAHTEESLSAFAAGYPADVASSDLERAIAALSELDGRTVNDEIVGEIFSHFCVGK